MSLKYKVADDITTFVLRAGTEFQLGSEKVKLDEDAVVSIDRPLSYDSVVETISGAGQAAANAVNFPHTETRDGVKYSITYGGRGQRIETAETVEPKEAKPKATKARPKG